MKITPTAPALPEFLTKTYTLTMSGAELLRLFRLSYEAECGNYAPLSAGRFNQEITRALGMSTEVLEAHADHLQRGEYVP